MMYCFIVCMPNISAVDNTVGILKQGDYYLLQGAQIVSIF